MNVLITGHRIQKLKNYNIRWIQDAISNTLEKIQKKNGYVRGFSGMASGVDLWFCDSCGCLDIPYVACIPFEEQNETMDFKWQNLRESVIAAAVEVKHVKNSWMVEKCDAGIVVWDANKGGTHNVVQQLVEKNKGFYWLNPVKQCIWECF